MHYVTISHIQKEIRQYIGQSIEEMKKNLELNMELRELVSSKKFLQEQTWYQIFFIVRALLLLGLSFYFMTIIESFWLHLLNAFFMAVAVVQFGFINHNLGHNQFLANHKWLNNILGVLVTGIVLGGSYTWWEDSHNQHHGHPNQLGKDPDIKMPILAYSPKQLKDKKGFIRHMVEYQHIYFFILGLFEVYSYRIKGILYILKKRRLINYFELLSMGGHYVLFFYLIFSNMSLGLGIAYYVILLAFTGVYLENVFAPNHKGMPIIEENDQIDFIHHQILTTRNVRGNAFTTFLYGGLNYQIEHHLFPTLSQNKLKQVSKIVKDFCKKHEISYHETGIIDSYREILRSLKESSH